jgi:outer membrane cobalamin receptor
MTDQFNTLDYANRLESAGVPAAQAEVHAQALAQVLERCFSAAADTTRLRSELSTRISEVEANLRAEIKRVEVTLRAEIKEVEVTLRAEIKEVEVTLRAEIKELEVKLRFEIKESETRIRADLGSRIDRLEERMEERFRHQWWANGVMVAMQLGLFAMLAGLYFR